MRLLSIDTVQAPTIDRAAPIMTRAPNTSWVGFNSLEKIRRNTTEDCCSGTTSMIGATATAE